MTAVLILVLIILLFLMGGIIYSILIYNGLVRLKNEIEKAWSNVDVLLKQRFDELPKLVKVCEGYMKHERETLEAVIKARSLLNDAKTKGEMLDANNLISGALRSLLAVVEKYPELKADISFRQLQNRISEIEDQIADRRELFNETVNLYNIRIAQFPDVMIAKAFNYTPGVLWEIKPGDREDVKINFENTIDGRQ